MPDRHASDSLARMRVRTRRQARRLALENALVAAFVRLNVLDRGRYHHRVRPGGA